MTLTDLLVARIRASGPITVAAFMDAALYHPEFGYYASAPRRSGRSGDFYTSVDVGTLFGELVAVQLAEMWRILQSAGVDRFDLVEAGAGNGRFSRDILDAAAAEHPDLYQHVRLTLVDESATARAAQAETLAPHRDRFISAATLPSNVGGVILANELLDALPVHLVTMTPRGLNEIYIAERSGSLVETTGPLSNREIAHYVDALGVTLPTGGRAEIGLAAIRWIESAAGSLQQGFLLLVDYGHEALELFSPTHTTGTLVAYRSHALVQDWLADPGSRDLTAHVNLTAIRHAAERAGLTTLGIVDQTYFLTSLGLTERLAAGSDRQSLLRRLAAKTLVIPGGLGSTMKVMGFARAVGRPALTGLSSGRLT